MNELLIFGAGYSALACARRSADFFGRIAGTTRSPENRAALEEAGVRPLIFSGELTAAVEAAIAQASHLLVSIAPDENGDPVLNACRAAIRASGKLRWICYLSTVGVYGNHDGRWVSEASRCHPASKRSIARLEAEKEWTALAAQKKVPLAIFRLSGIYGPGRNAFVNIEKGTSRRLVKPGQVFNRIHRDDIAKAFRLAAEKRADGVFNITDDEPAAPQDVVTFAHKLAGVEPPAEIDFENAQLSPMARSFYGENKRVANEKSKLELGMRYDYPDYRLALSRMWAEKSWR